MRVAEMAVSESRDATVWHHSFSASQKDWVLSEDNVTSLIFDFGGLKDCLQAKNR
jgi:hypothetical protein